MFTMSYIFRRWRVHNHHKYVVFLSCEKCGHLEIECHEGNETEKLIEKEDNYEVELISALDELREQNNSLKKELMKQKENRSPEVFTFFRKPNKSSRT